VQLVRPKVFVQRPQAEDGHVFPPRVDCFCVHHAHNYAEICISEVAAETRAGRRGRSSLDPDEVIVYQLVRVEPLQ
jgi:hypothetical protein